MHISGLLALSLIATLTACGSNMPDPETRHSGFLGDYSRLTHDPIWSNSQYWVKPGLKPAQSYQKRILLDPPVFKADAVQQAQAASREADVQKALDYLDAALRRELRSAGYQLTGQPGAGTLRLRTAISGAARTARDMTAKEYIPVGFVISSGMRAAGMRDEALRVFFETEVKDARSGELLAQSVSGATGSELAPSTQATLEDVYPALDAWARQVRERLDHAFAQ